MCCMWCMYVHVAARPRKKARAANHRREGRRGHYRERPEKTAERGRTQHGSTAQDARRSGDSTARRGTHMRLFRIPSAAPSRSARGTSSCTRSTRGVHAARRTGQRGTDGPPRRAPLLNQRAPRPGTVRPVFLRADRRFCARTAASAHRKGARTPRPPSERPDPFSDLRPPARQGAPREEGQTHTR